LNSAFSAIAAANADVSRRDLSASDHGACIQSTLTDWSPLANGAMCICRRACILLLPAARTPAVLTVSILVVGVHGKRCALHAHLFVMQHPDGPPMSTHALTNAAFDSISCCCDVLNSTYRSLIIETSSDILGKSVEWSLTNWSQVFYGLTKRCKGICVGFWHNSSNWFRCSVRQDGIQSVTLSSASLHLSLFQ
jgi:hypothetical protein